MNNTLETILSHRSIRRFTSEKLSKEQINTIIKSAQQASTSSYMQAYSIIGVTDENKKRKLADITGQKYVQENGHLFIFCADYNRHTIKANHKEKESMVENLENTEHLLVASVDAALAAQNASIAAESMGLGICYIGSIRNDVNRVDQLLKLPEHVIPLFGLVVGYPEQKPEQKPRLPMGGIYFENEYSSPTALLEHVNEFDSKISSYYANRSKNQRNDTWSSQMIRSLSTPRRSEVTDYVQQKGFNKR